MPPPLCSPFCSEEASGVMSSVPVSTSLPFKLIMSGTITLTANGREQQMAGQVDMWVGWRPRQSCL